MALFQRILVPVDDRGTRKRRLFRLALLGLLVLIAARGVAAQTNAPDRAALLYETHCVTCHTEQVHWRDKRLPGDWDGLRAQVNRWQEVQSLHWSQDDVTAVTRLLNERYYGFPPPPGASGHPGGGSAVHAP
ncbi:cytochrome C [Ramlibacter sp. MMS24-I3-19]|uniref:cytochrome C n=1 Tax=Ramlibacter sp. MMS24-I3-19 TaxID=3416606 RepID=UPI003D03B6B0